MSLKPSAGSDSELKWIKSSYSSNDGPECVEAAAACGMVHVRDSKNAQGPRLTFTPGAWTGFVSYASER